MPELRCLRDDCGRYFEVADPTRETVRCPHCGYERAVPDDLGSETSPVRSSPDEGGDQDGETAASAAVTAEAPVTIRITIEVLPGGRE